MVSRSPKSKLKADWVATGLISRNEDNPRLFFRPDELDTLTESIHKYGIQVPLAVYKKKGGSGYVLIDGERRWRCATKLNMKEVPVLIQEEPSPLQNLVLMFNIHSLREQWDYLTIALKLPVLKERFKEENGKVPNETELSDLTGFSRGQIRRCLFLLDLPIEFRDMLMEELQLPKPRQRLSEDFFIEMERSLKAVQKRFPETLGNVDRVRHVLVEKYKDDRIKNVTDFRMLSKIATSIENFEIRESIAKKSLEKIFDKNSKYGIEELYKRYFEGRFDEKKAINHIFSLDEFLRLYLDGDLGQFDFSNEFLGDLRGLNKRINRVLKDN